MKSLILSLMLMLGCGKQDSNTQSYPQSFNTPHQGQPAAPLDQCQDIWSNATPSQPSAPHCFCLVNGMSTEFANQCSLVPGSGK